MLHLAHGENPYHSLKVARKAAGSDCVVVDGDDLESLDDIFRHGDSISMFASEPATVLLKRFFKNRKKTLHNLFVEELERRDQPPAIVLWEEGTADKRTKLFKYLQKNAEVHESPEVDERSAMSFVSAVFKKHGLNVPNQTLFKFVEIAGLDLHALEQQAHKLVLLLKSEGRIELTQDDLGFVSRSHVDTIPWELMDAMAARNKKKALAVANELMKQPGGDQLVIGLLRSQLRALYLASRSDLSQDELSQLGLKPYTLRKARQYVRSFPRERIIVLYDKLAGLDLGIKQGTMEPELGINLLLASI
ncbi:MAG: DNA polymerase III subunit delta [candidate division WS6 bacterium OLB20]|uniref:DNA-directed DNA polymerase n=1 Tax=candidate division WS6 bacterium OLB20 TaxID=1617426 RepID=A0A136LVX8_9BACT|nr:MAG: DNA polymerase III subunit delta [candidate division WS6 bacterium OLB20]